MNTSPIVESCMRFGPYEEGHCFHIEASPCYQRIKKDLRMAEFLLLKTRKNGHPVIWVVEAKSSSPVPDKHSNFQTFIQEIKAKLTNALMLGVAACLQKHPDAQLPPAFRTLALNTADFGFVLVINGHKKDWLPPLQEALSKALKPIIKTWGLPANSVAVLNHELALEYGLISATL